MVTKVNVDPTGLDLLDPASAASRDATHFRAIVAAQKGVNTAEEQLRETVRAARQAGDSWLIIGAALGVTKQAAQQRFGR